MDTTVISKSANRTKSGSRANGTLVVTDVTSAAVRLPAFEGHERVVIAKDPASGLHAIVAIHDRTFGPALGGCRMWPYASETDALVDALRLSRGMTYKNAMASLPAGGGKSVIIGDPRRGKSEALFRAFGRFLNQFHGDYVTGEDVGVSATDMDAAASESIYVLGTNARGGDPSPMTAYGVYVGIDAAVRHRLRRPNLDGVTVAVQGLGSVGFKVCERLHKSGVKLIVADLDDEAVARVTSQFGATAVAPDQILETNADVFAPCALDGIINDQSIWRLRSAVIAGAANNQLLEDRHGEALHRRHILYAPDYVINAGGVIAVYDQLSGRALASGAMAKVALIGDTLAEIFARSDREDYATNVIADRIARERIRCAKGAA
jgi:leucine dehydrogenase